MPIQRAVLSVYDKTGIVDFARCLVEDHGVEILSTGGTARTLSAAGLAVTPIESITGFPEMMDGRVKTLHPHVHAGLLARRDNPADLAALEQAGIKPIDMVVISLYPFSATIANPDCALPEALEMIDIGGPCMLRAAAKNHADVVVVPDLCWAADVLQELADGGEVSADLRRTLAAATFEITAAYDATVAGYLDQTADPCPRTLVRPLHRVRVTRYGENPGQRGALYADAVPPPEPNLLRRADDEADPLIGAPEVSFNNYQDAHAALELCRTLTLGCPDRAAAVCIKHTNPCGVGLHADPLQAHRLAYLGDPRAAMGGVWAQNRPVDADLAQAAMHSLDRWGRTAGAGAFFLEVWIAPQFSGDAIDTIHRSKAWGQRVRLFAVGSLDIPRPATALQHRHLVGGSLVQTVDRDALDPSEWRQVTERAPTAEELFDLKLAWAVAMHTTSNAISLCRAQRLIGNGAGQMSRVRSCKLAVDLAQDNGHALTPPENATTGSSAVAASDAFFPFADGPEILIRNGVRAIVQPGGSKRDADTIAVCNNHGVAMLFTDTRHFRH